MGLFKARLFSKNPLWQEIKGGPDAPQLMIQFLCEAFPASPRNNSQLAIWLSLPQRMSPHRPCSSSDNTPVLGSGRTRWAWRGRMCLGQCAPRLSSVAAWGCSTRPSRSPRGAPRAPALPRAPVTVLRFAYFDMLIPDTAR